MVDYSWVPWFRELVRGIADGGEADLVEKARAVDWQVDDPTILRYGDDNVDPFSFLYSLTSQLGNEKFMRRLRSVGEVFAMETVSPTGPPNIPAANPVNQLFHQGGDGRPELLWRLFKQAARDTPDINSEDFDDALQIGNVAISKLTQTLFIMNANHFLPADHTSEVLQFEPKPRDYEEYVVRVDAIKALFPGCAPYEINTFLDTQAKDLLIRPETSFFQVSTNVYNDGVDHWPKFESANGLWTGAGESPSGSPYGLEGAERGDVILVRFGFSGRGIGVVEKNGYVDDGWSKDARISVYWINKRDAQLAHKTRQHGFESVGKGSQTYKAFSEAEAYASTLALIEELGDYPMAQLIETEEDLRDNLSAFVEALDDEDDTKGKFHGLLERGLCYVGRDVGDGWQFAPSRYMGHKNALRRWRENLQSAFAGGVTNDRISKILGHAPEVGTERIRQLFIEFAKRHSVTPRGHDHKFWTLPSGEFERRSDDHGSSVGRGGTVTPLNRILFGPPGTGKTFDARSDAVQIIDGAPADDVKARFNELREAGQIEFVTFHQNYAYEDFIEGIRPVLHKDELAYELHDGIFREIAKRASERQNDDYVLIIDEINRGNIAKIFGELITLIEPSKRLGGDDATEARLPYSQELFGVPPNLHLIGTMNTADRGILLLDAALRRRFEFVEKMPDAKLVATDIEGVNGRALLTAINERIVENQDRDHQIGHTYLMGVETLRALAHTFQTQIIPLLQEYFYDDWEKMHNVLNGNAFIKKRGDTDSAVFEVLPRDDDKWQQLASYRTIYDGSSGGLDGE